MVNRTGRVKKGFPWLRIAVHIIGWLPLVVLIYNFATDHLTVNPIQAAEQRLGRTAVYFLIASLSVTPVYILTGWRDILPRRRALGMYTFFYASLHFLTFAGLDYGFNFGQIFDLITTKPFIIIGTLAFLLLVPLAVTSFDYFVRRMKKSWKRLHWLVYPAALIVILHFAWARKGDLFRLQGNIVQPLLLGLLLIGLFILRIPPVRRSVSALRQKIRGRFITRPNAQH
jgi:methionine sulfoxide reductase heme-binding subunit